MQKQNESADCKRTHQCGLPVPFTYNGSLLVCLLKMTNCLPPPTNIHTVNIEDFFSELWCSPVVVVNLCQLVSICSCFTTALHSTHYTGRWTFNVVVTARNALVNPTSLIVCFKIVWAAAAMSWFRVHVPVWTPPYCSLAVVQLSAATRTMLHHFLLLTGVHTCGGIDKTRNGK